MAASGYFLTVNDALVVWLRLPLTPVMARLYVRRDVDDSVLIVSVEVPVAGFGVNVTVEPDGWPARLSVTDPAKPFRGVIVTV